EARKASAAAAASTRRCRSRASWPGRHLGRVAGEAGGRLEARVALGRARAAVVLAGDGGGAELRAAQRRAEQLQVAVDVGGGVDVQAGVAGRAQRVVDAGRGEVAEPAGEVDRVRARLLELGGGRAQGLGRGPEL